MSDDKAAAGERIVESWMVRAIRSYGPAYWEELPISSMDGRFSDRSLWLAGAEECFPVAMRVRDRLSIPVAVCMALVLRPTETEQEQRFGSLDEIGRELGDTPPLFIMSAGARLTDPAERSQPGARETPILLGGQGVRRSVRQRFDEETRLYRRAVWIQG